MKPIFEVDLGYIPPPPPLPKFNPGDEAPKWSWTRLNNDLPADKGPIPWTPIGTQPKSSKDPDWRGVIRDNVVEYPTVEPYRYGYVTPSGYFWFDTPDYADPFKKLGYAVKWFAMTGLWGAVAKGVIERLDFTFKNNLFIIRKITVPWFLAGMAASVTAVAVANLRGKKDDYWNYAIGGIVFGCIMGRKGHVSNFRWVIGSVPAALIVKYNAEINGSLWTQVNMGRMRKFCLGNNTGEDGISSGDLRFGFRRTYGDPGRDTR